MSVTQHRPPGILWAYAYLIVPPQPRARLTLIGTMVDDENAAARGGARTWTGRLVQEKQSTHILIVSDSPEQDLEINQRLEAELNELKAEFRLTRPMVISGGLEGIAAPVPSNGNGK